MCNKLTGTGALQLWRHHLGRSSDVQGYYRALTEAYAELSAPLEVSLPETLLPLPARPPPDTRVAAGRRCSAQLQPSGFASCLVLGLNQRLC